MLHPVHSIEGNGIADGVVIHPLCLVDYPPSRSPSLARVPVTARETRIGHRTELMPFSMVYRGAWIGADCLIGSHATVREDATIGDRCIIGQYACVSYDAVLADEVRVQNGTLMAGCGAIRVQGFAPVHHWRALPDRFRCGDPARNHDRE
jgi:UDP-3-O-[3-hydroxymyristoyl] glucosamine N-acyltransferase